MTSSSRPGPLLRAGLLLAGLGVFLLSRPVSAGPLSEYTGYTRPSNVPLSKPKAIKPAAFAPGGKPGKQIGGTVYFTVLDRAEGTKEDPWGTGAKVDFEKIFMVSRDVKGRKLDTEARYLFLYQVVNDSGLDAPIQYCSVRLLLDPRLVTSWGHLVLRDEKEKGGIAGAGFAVEQFKDGKILPIAAVAGDTPYQPVAPPHRASGHYLFRKIQLYEGNIRPAAAAKGEELGREPDAVWLVNSDVFDDETQGELNPRYRLPREVNDRRRLVPDGPYETWNWVMDAKIRGIGDTVLAPSPGEWLRASGPDSQRRPARPHFPMIRAYFHENPILPGERSTIFGFTCHYPPAFDLTSIADRRKLRPLPQAGGAVAPAGGKEGGEEGAGNDLQPISFKATAFQGGAGGGAGGTAPAASGSVPTPVAPAGGGGGGGGGAAPGGIGGVGGVGGPGMGGVPIGAGTGGGFGATPVAPFLAPRGLSGGGGVGGGSGSGNGNGTPNQGENQNQGNSGNITNVSVNQNQLQLQQQQQLQLQLQLQLQKQKQEQENRHHHKPHGNVVPAPPAWLLGVFGLPIFAVLGWRRKSSRVPVGPAA